MGALSARSRPRPLAAGALVAVVVLQLCSGRHIAYGADAAGRSTRRRPSNCNRPTRQPALHAVITTCHQTTAAVLLGVAVFGRLVLAAEGRVWRQTGAYCRENEWRTVGLRL